MFFRKGGSHDTELALLQILAAACSKAPVPLSGKADASMRYMQDSQGALSHGTAKACSHPGMQGEPQLHLGEEAGFGSQPPGE